MSLRIIAPPRKQDRTIERKTDRGDHPQDQPQSDAWASRLAKLIPAEALGLYGAGQALIPPGRVDALWFLATVCLVFAGILRWRATQDANRKPQYKAVAISLASFALWVAAIRPPSGPLDLGGNAFFVSLLALIWGTFIPIIYTGQ